jgi:hypothetical protein
LRKFFYIWAIDKTHNKCLAHELNIRFKIKNFARKLFLMRQRKTHLLPFSGKFISRNFCLFYITSTQTIHIDKKFHEMNGFVKLGTDSKLFTFFIHPVLKENYRDRIVYGNNNIAK